MKITDVKSCVLQHELKQELGYSQAYFKTRTAHIVQVFTDEGVTGLGECFGPGNVALGNKAIVEQVLKPMIVGEDPWDVERIWHKMYNSLRDHGMKGMPLQSISGVDIALWDIKGKVARLPLYKLLGGAFRDKLIPYGYGMLFRKVKDLPADFAKEAAAIAEMGFTATKLKIGLTPELDVKLAKAVRDAVPEGVKVMADANHAYNSTVAIPLGRKLEEMGIYWFEEPVAPEDYDGYREVKDALDMAVAGGECEYTRFGFRELISRRCVDFLQPEVCGLGGITEFLKVRAMASAWGIPVIPHVWGSEVAVAANMHLVASEPHCPGSIEPVQPFLEFDTTPNLFREHLAKEPLNIRKQVKKNGGWVALPTKPGIGIELDETFVKKYRIA